MRIDFTPEDLAFRDEVRGFLDEALTPELREAGRLTTSVFTDLAWSAPWHRALYEKGRLAEAEIELAAIEITEQRVMPALAAGGPPGPASSMLKMRGAEAMQRLDELAVEAAAYWGFVDLPAARQPGGNVAPIGPEAHVTGYLYDRAASIYGGSNEVQRNIMAKLALGL
jgi:alkylation response protein AidB-like acyl-CoA dehydrogenase